MTAATIVDHLVHEGARQLWWSDADTPFETDARAVLHGSLPVLAAHVASHAHDVIALVRTPGDAVEAVRELADAVAEAAGPPAQAQVVVGGDLLPQMLQAGATALCRQLVHDDTAKTVIVLQAALPMLAQMIRDIDTQAPASLDPTARVRAVVDAICRLAEEASV